MHNQPTCSTPTGSVSYHLLPKQHTSLPRAATPGRSGLRPPTPASWGGGQKRFRAQVRAYWYKVIWFNRLLYVGSDAGNLHSSAHALCKLLRFLLVWPETCGHSCTLFCSEWRAAMEFRSRNLCLLARETAVRDPHILVFKFCLYIKNTPFFKLVVSSLT
jgi:hypothetical protein